MFRIIHLAVNPFEENVLILVDEDTKDAIVIDPGMLYPEELQKFDEIIREEGLHLTQIVNTHQHLDHIFGANAVKDKYGIPLAASPSDDTFGQSVATHAARFGIKAGAKPVVRDIALADGDTITVGKSTLHVLAVPGHTPGGLAFYCPEQKFIITGDSLFRGSIGRTDLGGDQATLVSSIRSKLLTLPDDTTVIPGHGPTTTIGAEKRHNPYIV
ncbi:MAG: MBL fold metallo-hydrolase [Muribaculaceae bacterium]